MDKKERLNEAYNYIRFKGVAHTLTDVADMMGSTLPNVSAAMNGKEKNLTDSFLRRFSKAFPDINIDWLLTGEGEMLTTTSNEITEAQNDSYYLTPVVYIDSVGGMHSENDILSPEYIERYIPIAGARRGDVAIYQSGNSMVPAIPPGALLLIREVEGWREYMGYGDVFVLLLDDGRRITKEIRRYDEDPKNYFWCVSYNPDVADEELPKRMVYRVWKVIKVLIDKGW